MVGGLRRAAILLAAGLAGCWIGAAIRPARAAATDWVGTPRASVRLIAGDDATGSGPQAIRAALQFRLGEGWHGYWRTPGDAGVAPRFDWTRSQNVTDATVAWPAPQRLEIAGLQNAIYTGDFALPVSLRRRDPAAATQLALGLDYAICGTVCIPVHADLSLALPPGHGVASSEDPLIAAAQARVPGTPENAGIEVQRVSLAQNVQPHRLTVQVSSRGMPFDDPQLFVETTGGALAPTPHVALSRDGRVATFRSTLPNDAGPTPILTIVDGNRAAAIPAIAVDLATPMKPHGLAAILAIAFLGGLVLNVMPCVLPVLAIKLSGVRRRAGRERRDIRLGFAATACGILASFLVLAAVPIGLRSAGTTIGWGIQFQQPWFLAGMAAVTTLFAAALFDWLPIGLPAGAGRLAMVESRRMWLQAFLTGVVSTLLATPCSAPFVGTAVGFALARGPAEIVAIFAVLGLGMASPFLLVAAAPGLVAWLPRPGAWMVRVRQALGFLLLATAAWLAAVLASLAGQRAAVSLVALLAGLLLVRYWSSRQPVPSAVARFATGAIAGAAILVGLAAPPPSGATAADGAWAAYDPAAVAAAVAAGHPVLVDVSATWCLTCKVNDLSTLDAPAVRDRLAASGALRMRADWSRPNPTIAAFLQGFGRFGIPFDVVYGPNRPDGEPLPELLTPGTLLAALDRAGSAPESASAAKTSSSPP